LIPEVWWFRALMLFFSLMLFGYFVLFFKRCFSYRNGNKIIVRGRNIMLPFTKNGINLNFSFSEITELEVYETYYSEIIQLKLSKGILEIEKIWMKKKQYFEFLQILKSNINKTHKEVV
ncbi:MAG: hypothetical protein AAFX55_11390, partial [Bacteroidota bacterium]